jgi:hypothetical protein
MNKISILVLALLALLATSQADIFGQYYTQCRKIAEAMTLDQLAGQMIQADFETISNAEKQTTDPNEAVTLALGSLLVSGMGVPTENGNMARIPLVEEYEKHLDAFRKGNVTNWKKLTLASAFRLRIAASTRSSFYWAQTQSMEISTPSEQYCSRITSDSPVPTTRPTSRTWDTGPRRA